MVIYNLKFLKNKEFLKNFMKCNSPKVYVNSVIINEEIHAMINIHFLFVARLRCIHNMVLTVNCFLVPLHPLSSQQYKWQVASI